jgi:hypothetical protein
VPVGDRVKARRKDCNPRRLGLLHLSTVPPFSPPEPAGASQTIRVSP